MKISKSGLDFIKQWETGSKTKFDKEAYLCPAGVWTIGFGSIRWLDDTPVKQGDTITREQAYELLHHETSKIEQAINETIKVPLSQNQFDVIASWTYNVGLGWLTGKGHKQATMIKKLNKGDYEAVAKGLPQFKKTTSGKKVRGLLNRRNAEVELWRTPDPAPKPIPAPEQLDDIKENGMAQAVKPDTPSETALVTAIGAPATASMFGVVSNVSNPYAMTLMLILIAGVGYFLYKRFKQDA